MLNMIPYRIVAIALLTNLLTMGTGSAQILNSGSYSQDVAEFPCGDLWADYCSSQSEWSWPAVFGLPHQCQHGSCAGSCAGSRGQVAGRRGACCDETSGPKTAGPVCPTCAAVKQRTMSSSPQVPPTIPSSMKEPTPPSVDATIGPDSLPTAIPRNVLPDLFPQTLRHEANSRLLVRGSSRATSNSAPLPRGHRAGAGTKVGDVANPPTEQETTRLRDILRLVVDEQDVQKAIYWDGLENQAP